MTYIYQRADWPAFRWDSGALAGRLAAVRHHQGRLLGRVESLGFDLRLDATMRTLTTDALKTSEIEGEHLDADQVRSSVARRLGLETSGLKPVDKRADAIVAVLLDATQGFRDPLTVERLFGWHATLFPDGQRARPPMTVDGWRTDAHCPMIVVEPGKPGRETIRYLVGPATTAERH